MDRPFSFSASSQLIARARVVAAGGVHSNARLAEVPWPLFFASGSGARLTDVDGNELIDYVLGFGPLLLGHQPKPVVDALRRQLESGILFAGQSLLEIEAAECITQMVPSAERVRFCSTGTEAVQLAIRLARHATGRDKILLFQGHYHGWADSVYWNVTTNGPVTTDDPDLIVPQPESSGIPASVGATVLVSEWNDAARLTRIMARHGSEIAAVIMEPVMAMVGIVEPASGYLEHVRAVTKQYGSVLIFDEVVTGFRLGRAGAQGRFGVTPDLTVLGKALAAGVQVACVAGRQDVMDTLATKVVGHGGTFNANQLAMAATVATLRLLSDPEASVYNELDAKGTELMRGIRQLAEGLAIHLQGYPSMFSVFTTGADRVTTFSQALAVDHARLGQLRQRLVQHGVRITNRGTFFVSSAHTDLDIAETLNAVAASLGD